MREKYESLSVAVLKDLAKSQGIPHSSSMRKAQLVDALVRLSEKQEAEAPSSAAQKESEPSVPATEKPSDTPDTPTSATAPKTPEKPDQPVRSRRNPPQRRGTGSGNRTGRQNTAVNRRQQVIQKRNGIRFLRID